MDSLHAFQRSERLEVDRLVQTSWERLEEISPILILKGVNHSMRETAPKVVETYRQSEPLPSTPAERERYLLGLFTTYINANIDLSGREVPAYEPEDIQIEEIIIPKDQGSRS